MGETFNERIGNLRKKTESLLAQVDDNSNQINKEIRNLYSENLISTKCDTKYKDEENLTFQSNTKAWKLRNDSSGVCGVLCPDYFSASPKYMSASMPNIPHLIKLQIKSNTHSRKQHSENIPRKPIKECYCYPEIKKLQHRSTRTEYTTNKKCSLYNHTKSLNDFKLRAANKSVEKIILTPPISCETLGRLQKIDYEPKSQFLRHVRNKICHLPNEKVGDGSETCYRSSCCHKFTAEKRVQGVEQIDQLESSRTQLQSHHTSKESTVSETSTTLKPIEEKRCSRHNDVLIYESNNKIKVPSQKSSKSKATINRTLFSKKSIPELRKNKLNVKTQTRKSKRPTQLHNTECTCGHENKLPHLSKLAVPEAHICKHTDGHYIDPEYPRQTVCVNNNLKDESNTEYSSDKNINDVRQFREQNYFATHGSSQTLMSSKSTGSLEQYLLNERLFPEVVKEIHKKDLVVTMPACATIQRKYVHYFPRYIVRQENKNCNATYKKNRCQSCPLTGHAIDLGVLKIRPPINSLALKYQKRLVQ